MTIIVEDGSGNPAAESFASTADADLYHNNRGNTAWFDLDTVDKEAALRRAADYMTETYRGRWKGYRSQNLQALDWPRKGVMLTDLAIFYNVRYDTIPVEVKNAQIELAWRASQLGTAPLAADLDRATIREAATGVSVEYDRYSPQQTRFRQIDMMLSPFLAASANTCMLVRS